MIRHVATTRARHAICDGGFADGGFFDGGYHEGSVLEIDGSFEMSGGPPTGALPSQTPGSGGEQDLRDGAHSNGQPQGQCFADIVAGAVKAIDLADILGQATFDLARGATLQVVAAEASLSAAFSALKGGIDAARESVACQTLDNAAEANALGLGAVRAP